MEDNKGKIQRTKLENQMIFSNEFMPEMNNLFNFAFHLSRNESDAEDLVQETMMKSFRFVNSYQKGTNAKAWLFRILKNAFINQYRKKSKAGNKVDFEEAITFQNTEKQSTTNHTDLREEMFKGMMGDEVTGALNSLPVDFKTVILLCDIEGFTYEEIAKIVDIPIGTVRSRLHRGRIMLKEKLVEYGTKMGYKSK